MNRIKYKSPHKDAIAEAKKHPRYEELAQEARARIVLATEIYRAREKKGLSQQALAKRAKTTQKVISKVENGEVNVGIDLMFKIAQALGLRMQVGRTSLL